MMKCSECQGPQTVEQNATIRYDMGGLHHVILQGVEIAKCDNCGETETTIPRIAELHRAIAKYFSEQPRLLLGAEIRFLRKHIGLSAENFAQRMGVTRSTVSRWENDKEPMGTPADHLLRALVASHRPSQNYAVDDLLKSLPDKLRKRKRPVNVEMRNVGAEWKAELAVA